MHQVDHKSKLKIASRPKNHGHFMDNIKLFESLKVKAKAGCFIKNDILVGLH